MIWFIHETRALPKQMILFCTDFSGGCPERAAISPQIGFAIWQCYLLVTFYHLQQFVHGVHIHTTQEVSKYICTNTYGVSQHVCSHTHTHTLLPILSLYILRKNPYFLPGVFFFHNPYSGSYCQGNIAQSPSTLSVLCLYTCIYCILDFTPLKGHRLKCSSRDLETPLLYGEHQISPLRGLCFHFIHFFFFFASSKQCS